MRPQNGLPLSRLCNAAAPTITNPIITAAIPTSPRPAHLSHVEENASKFEAL
jgi:hypothetical protein